MSSRQQRTTNLKSQRRSKTGCPECRQRKVKCDEKRPTCGQCEKGQRNCHIMDNLFKPYVLSAATSESHASEQDLSIDQGNAVDDDSQWYVSGATVNPPTSLESDDLPNEETVPVFTSSQGYVVMQDQPLQHAGSNHGFTPISQTSRVTAEGTSSDKLEEAFFIRYFSETIAPWFDIVNFQRYFGHECIILLRENSLLRFATCALAAKQLGQASVSGPVHLENVRLRDVATKLQRGDLDFLWYGAKYYDRAIRTLVQQITPRVPNTLNESPVASPAMSLSQSDIMTRASSESPIVRLLATCMLIQYESLGGDTRGWTGHLNGFDKLLDLLDDGSLFRTNPLTQQVFDAKSQRALRAAFWWYVINDLEESFLARRKTRTDLENISLWRHMGLHLREDGEIIDLDTSETPDAPPHLQEDLMSFALIKTLCKLIDLLAPLPAPTTPSLMTSPSSNNNHSTQFQMIQSELEKWLTCSSAAFRPDDTWYISGMSERSQTIFNSAEWYSHSFRAVTMLYYHMARILLLIYQPPHLWNASENQKSTFDLLVVLREIETQLQSHARKIVSIHEGMRDYGAVRARAIQPLYVAGRSLTQTQDRCFLIELLRSIQDDLGIVCEYRVEHLLLEWSVSLEALNLPRR